MAILENKTILFDFDSLEVIKKFDTIENKEGLGSIS
jgi:hypothetical protein